MPDFGLSGGDYSGGSYGASGNGGGSGWGNYAGILGAHTSGAYNETKTEMFKEALKSGMSLLRGMMKMPSNPLMGLLSAGKGVYDLANIQDTVKENAIKNGYSAQDVDMALYIIDQAKPSESAEGGVSYYGNLQDILGNEKAIEGLYKQRLLDGMGDFKSSTNDMEYNQAFNLNPWEYYDLQSVLGGNKSGANNQVPGMHNGTDSMAFDSLGLTNSDEMIKYAIETGQVPGWLEQKLLGNYGNQLQTMEGFGKDDGGNMLGASSGNVLGDIPSNIPEELHPYLSAFTQGSQQATDMYDNRAMQLWDDYQQYKTKYAGGFDQIQSDYEDKINNIPGLTYQLPDSLGGGAVPLAPKVHSSMYGNQARTSADILGKGATVTSNALNNLGALSQNVLGNQMQNLGNQLLPFNTGLDLHKMQFGAAHNMDMAELGQPSDLAQWAPVAGFALQGLGTDEGSLLGNVWDAVSGGASDLVDSIADWF